MALEMAVERVGEELAVLRLTGALTLGTNLKIVDANVQQLISSGCNKLVMDLTECTYADSSGLGFLVMMFGLATNKGGTLRLCGVGERVSALLTMTHTSAILPQDADSAESIAKLQA